MDLLGSGGSLDSGSHGSACGSWLPASGTSAFGTRSSARGRRFSDSAGDGSVLGEIPPPARENAGVRDDARFGEGLAGMVPM